jgi:exodeoxyribonuclease VII large subunit
LVAVNDRLKQGAKYDVLVIIRGGGDKAGLLQLNEIKIARGICRFPIPVLVGVGHERDTTILDEVANQSFPTPSLVASYIKSCVVKNAREAQVHYEKFAGASQRLFYLAIQDAGHYRSLLEIQAQKQLERSKATVIHTKQTIVFAAGTDIQRSKYSNSTLYENLRNSATQQTLTAGEYVRSLKRDILNNAHSNAQRASGYTRNHFERLIYASKNKLNSDRSNITRLNTQLISDARYKVSQLSSSISSEYQELTALAGQIVSGATYTLNFQRCNLVNAGQLSISKSKGEITLLIQRVLLQDPKKILSLGFAYLKGNDDSVITKAGDLEVGQEVSIYMKDGKAKALILGE